MFVQNEVGYGGWMRIGMGVSDTLMAVGVSKRGLSA